MTSKLFSFITAAFVFWTGTAAAREPACSDNVCMIEARNGTMPAGEIFPVVCPLGQSVVRPIEQVPRLSTLDGKTIAIVGGSFMASVTHPELKRLILKEYPTAKVYVLGEVGSAGVFASHSKEELLDNTRKVLWPSVKKALMTPLSDAERIIPGKVMPNDPRQTVFSGTLDEVNRHFNEMDWSDGLPIVPPTMERINEFLKYGGLKYDTPVATLPIAHRKTLALHVAACGVMSGCRPEYMPILVALTKALGAPDFRRTLGSTHAWNPYCWLNGPVARQLGIDCGQGEISESANMAIARFMNLALKNLSGYYIKQNRMGTFGYLMPWCMVEDEEACARVGWSPYHVGQGYDANASTITVASALMWGNNMAPSTGDPACITQLVAWDVAERCQFALGSGKQYTYRTILLTEPVARSLKKEYADKESFERTLIGMARRPLHERAFANYHANPGSRINPGTFPISRYEKRLARVEGASFTPCPEWYAQPEGCKGTRIATVPVMKPGMTAILITGDNARNKVQVMPGGGCSTVKICLPDNWDTLMQEAGYAPLKQFYNRK